MLKLLPCRLANICRISVIAILHAPFCLAQQHPPTDAAAWWGQTTALANDAMQGRDTGTEAYDRAARYVADQFAKAGLLPAGEDHTYYQQVPMHEVDLDMAHSSIEVLDPSGRQLPRQASLLQQITLIPREGLPNRIEGELYFLGYGEPKSIAASSLQGKVAVYFNNVPGSVNAAARDAFVEGRLHALLHSGAIAILSIDNPSAIEPFHWPAAYARSVTLSTASVANHDAPPSLRISADAASSLFTSSDHDFRDILLTGGQGKPLAPFPLALNMRIHLVTSSKDIHSPNVLGILPGSNKSLAAEYVALSAHLDGYGFGTAVQGDSLYNGALDDAAYVATLIELAQSLHTKAPARSLLFCVFTGEEKGLLGSSWFTSHLTVPVHSIVADLNLDQLRPIFPLKILTMEGLNDSTLGTTARTVAGRYQIEVRPDHEPERNLFRRADNYNFVRIGVPIGSFIFGYDPGTPEEKTYRDWYARRYHKPQDDLDTPIDWKAAVTFNRYFGDLAQTIANQLAPPHWLSSSPYAPAHP